MLIKIGFDIAYTAPQPTPMVVMLSVHPSRVADLVAPENIVCDPPTPIHYYHDSFGNWCGRLVIPSGRSVLSNRATVRDSGLPDVGDAGRAADPGREPAGRRHLVSAGQPLLRNRPHDGSGLEPVQGHAVGWGRVQAICDYVHGHVTFGYQFAGRRPRARMTCTPSAAAYAATSRIWR